MANKILSTPPAAFEFLGTAFIAAVTTTTGDVSAAIDTKMTALGVTLDDGDLLQLHFSERTGSGMIVLGDSDQAVPASAFVIPGRTSPPFQWTGYRSDIPQVRAATGTATLTIMVFRYKSNA